MRLIKDAFIGSPRPRTVPLATKAGKRVCPSAECGVSTVWETSHEPLDISVKPYDSTEKRP
jgi:hypothetical protein